MFFPGGLRVETVFNAEIAEFDAEIAEREELFEMSREFPLLG